MSGTHFMKSFQIFLLLSLLFPGIVRAFVISYNSSIDELNKELCQHRCALDTQPQSVSNIITRMYSEQNDGQELEYPGGILIILRLLARQQYDHQGSLYWDLFKNGHLELLGSQQSFLYLWMPVVYPVMLGEFRPLIIYFLSTDGVLAVFSAHYGNGTVTLNNEIETINSILHKQNPIILFFNENSHKFFDIQQFPEPDSEDEDRGRSRDRVRSPVSPGGHSVSLQPLAEVELLLDTFKPYLVFIILSIVVIKLGGWFMG